jgi:uncharacterized membrane protein YeaQ/YmgE (transglycosylase-associated protein family)
MLTMIIGWALFGLVAGAVARLLHPGSDAMGWVGTMLLGVTGSLLGGGVAYLLGYGTSPTQGAGWILSILGAVALLAVGVFVGGRARRGA